MLYAIATLLKGTLAGQMDRQREIVKHHLANLGRTNPLPHVTVDQTRHAATVFRRSKNALN